MKSAARVQTPAEYIASLSPEGRAAISPVYQMVRKNMPEGYTESMLWGVIGWAIPLSRYPDTYNKQPLCYVALGSKKSYCSLYLMGCYGDAGQRAELERAFKDAGKKLDMGKSCVHFKSADDLPLAAIGKLIRAVSPDKWIAVYEKSREFTAAGKRAAAKRTKAAPRRTAARTSRSSAPPRRKKPA